MSKERATEKKAKEIYKRLEKAVGPPFISPLVEAIKYLKRPILYCDKELVSMFVSLMK